MNQSALFGRIFFWALSTLLMTLFMASSSTGNAALNSLIGAGLGTLLFGLFFAFERLFGKFRLRAFNSVALGLLFGFLMGQALLLVFDGVLDQTTFALAFQPHTIEILKISLFLLAIYLGTMLTIRYAEEICMSIPFVRFSPVQNKKRDLILDGSILSDPRLIDLVNSGLVDDSLVLPRYIVKELQTLADGRDENTKTKARKALETVKKLEALPSLNLRYTNTDPQEVADPIQKLVRLARILEANILSAELNKIHVPATEGILIINMNGLANSLKPLMHTGEQLKIKVQRYGKEPMQGVGYLEDGTMVVINGGGDYIGETVDAHVLSVKHTASGRMIFCNVKDEGDLAPQYAAESFDE